MKELLRRTAKVSEGLFDLNKKVAKEMQDDLGDYDLFIAQDLTGTSWDDAESIYFVSTAHDPSVGIFGATVSPMFKSIEELAKWWMDNRQQILVAIGDYDVDWNDAIDKIKELPAGQGVWEKKSEECMNCGAKIEVPEIDSDQPDASFKDPATHGICPQCDKPMYKKVEEKTEEELAAMKVPKSKPQKIFVQEIEKFKATLKKRGEELDYDLSEPGLDAYAFHDNKSVATDEVLYDIMVHGQAEYGFGKVLKTAMNTAMEDAGYYMEYEGQGVFNFVKE